ncbi:MAG: AAA family ATPase [Chloroflexi bacterium]|nr:AAA family ATPase [Chloroflexota bacterium]
MKAKRPPAAMLFLLGAPRLERHGQRVEMDTRKALALVAYLALTRQSHSRDALATLFYPDYDQAHARAALRRTLSTLQAALGEGYLEADRELIGLHPGAKLIVDVDEFQNRVAETRAHGHAPNDVCARCITPLAEAAAFYRDDFMAGFTLRDSPAFDEWQFFQTETLRRDLAGALEKLVRQHSAQREDDFALVYARRWLALDPLDEPAHRHLIKLYGSTGQRAAALRQYQECVRILHDELGVAPLEETTRVYETIKESGRRGERETGRQTFVSPSLLLSPSPPPLVGRQHEWDALLRAYRAIHADGHFIVLEGEMGIGKTRLAEQFVEYARQQGAVTLSARAYEGSANLAYGPFVEALRAALAHAPAATRLAQVAEHFRAEAARLLPELGAAALAPLDSPGAQIRFFEGIAQVLAALGAGLSPGVLFIDDLQWLDAASLELLAFIARRLRGRPLCLLGTLRTEATPNTAALRKLLAEGQRAGLATTVALARLDERAVMELVRAKSGLPRAIAERLYRETEGVPFFVIEYLAAMDNASTDWMLPENARAVLRARFLGLTETGSQVLSAAAVIGRSFNFEMAREVSGRSEEESVAALEELIGRGLVKELSGAVYDFSHEKLRALVYEEASQARRRLLHRRAADALLARARLRRETGARASQVAAHYRQAGQDAEAAEYYKLAGEHARGLYANVEALAHFRAALELEHPDAAALHEAIGDLLTLKGDYTAALASYEAAARSLAAVTPALDHKLGALRQRRGEWAQAEEHFQNALARLGDDAPSERARVHADWSLTAHQQGRHADAERLARRALALAQAVDDLRALAQAHNILGILARSRGKLDEARQELEQSVALADRLQEPEVRAAALNNLALVFADRGELERALELTEQALALCVSQGDRHREAALRNNLADLLHALGRTEEAMAHLKQSVTLFAEIGLEAGTLSPEIWKLVQW